MLHYAEAIKAIMNEELGDGIMSAIDMFATIDKIKGKTGEDRVVITLNGKVRIVLLGSMMLAVPSQFMCVLKDACIEDCLQSTIRSRQLRRWCSIGFAVAVPCRWSVFPHLLPLLRYQESSISALASS